MYKSNIQYIIILFCLIAFTSCKSTSPQQEQVQELEPAKIIAGAERLDQYIPNLEGKNVGLLVNHTSLINGKHLLDTLTSLKINVVKIFAPEHGFRGNADAGEHIDNSIDETTGVPIISIYGDHRKATPEDLEGVDVVIFDSQDVGARFFTYFSAMQLMLEACAENNVEMIILDRPNPNGHYVDGPILEMENKSYVGMNPVPIVFGLTAGEYTKMMVGEKWINKAESLKLTVIEMTGWDHNTPYSLTTKPSPNLPTDQSIALYPSTCLFEGTMVSVGRGTYTPFQIIGVPETIIGDYSFTPKSIVGMSKKPKYMGQECYGYDLSNVQVKNQIDLSYLIEFYNKSKDKEKFFNNYFVKLAGTDQLQKQIEEGKSEDEIRASWQSGLTAYKAKRKKYLLYEDFE